MSLRPFALERYFAPYELSVPHLFSSSDCEPLSLERLLTLADEETDEEQTFRIVGEDEADIKGGRLSVTSPLARALIGKGQGDSVEVMTPRGNKSYEVVTVDFG